MPRSSEQIGGAVRETRVTKSAARLGEDFRKAYSFGGRKRSKSPNLPPVRMMAAESRQFVSRAYLVRTSRNVAASDRHPQRLGLRNDLQKNTS
jgi:hypothetical protein